MSAADAVSERFGVNLKRRRRLAQLNQTELGERALLSRNEISFLELGQRTPRLSTALGLAAALDVELCDLLDGISWVVGARERSPGSFLVEHPGRQFLVPAPSGDADASRGFVVSASR